MKKIFLSVVLSLFAFITLTSTTFAWLNLQSYNVVDGFDIEASATQWLEISIDGINFSNEISTEEMKKAIGNNVLLKDLTSSDGINLKTSITKGSKEAVSGTDYVSFPLWFRTTSTSEKQLYLVNNLTNTITYDDLLKNENIEKGTFIVSEGINWTCDSSFQYDSDVFIGIGEVKEFHASEAARVSFQELPLDEFLFEKDQVDSRSLLQVKIFDLTGNETRGYGVTFGALDYFNSKREAKLNAPIEIPQTYYQLSSFKNPYEASDDNSLLATFTEGVSNAGTRCFYTKVQVNIWLEGWDADCFDAIMNDNMAMQFQFAGANLSKKTV